MSDDCDFDLDEGPWARGFRAGSRVNEGYQELYEKVSKENVQLKSLLAANVRVIKAELIKEIEEEKSKAKE